MKKKKYIYIKDENGKRRRCIFIEGCPVCREEFLHDLDQRRIQQLRFRMEQVRLDDTLDEIQKSSRKSEIMWRLVQLQREMNR